MNLEFKERAFEDLRYWIETDRKKAQKLMKLIEEVKRTPFEGIGLPEPLKYDFQGCWSRRIDSTNRLVYKVEKDIIRILSCRYHY